MTVGELSAPASPSIEAQQLYAAYVEEVHKRELSGIDNFDKSVLTLSSAGLGLSVSFLKDLVLLKDVVLPLLLYASWTMFTVATVSTMISFLVSGKALAHQKSVAYRAYYRGEDAAFDEVNSWNCWTRRLNLTSAITFISALVLTTVFVITNLESSRMATIKNTFPAGTLEHKGAPIPTMHRPSSAPSSTPPAQPASAPVSAPTGK